MDARAADPLLRAASLCRLGFSFSHGLYSYLSRKPCRKLGVMLGNLWPYHLLISCQSIAPKTLSLLPSDVAHSVNSAGVEVNEFLSSWKRKMSSLANSMTEEA